MHIGLSMQTRGVQELLAKHGVDRYLFRPMSGQALRRPPAAADAETSSINAQMRDHEDVALDPLAARLVVAEGIT